MAFWHTPPRLDEALSPAPPAPNEARQRVLCKYLGLRSDRIPNHGPLTQDRRLQTIRQKTVKVTLAKVGGNE